MDKNQYENLLKFIQANTGIVFYGVMLASVETETFQWICAVMLLVCCVWAERIRGRATSAKPTIKTRGQFDVKPNDP